MGVETLVQGGGVGIAIALIILIGKIWADSSNYSERVTDVVEKNATAIQSLKGAIDENTKITKETKDLMITMNGTRRKR